MDTNKDVRNMKGTTFVRRNEITVKDCYLMPFFLTDFINRSIYPFEDV